MANPLVECGAESATYTGSVQVSRLAGNMEIEV